MATSGVTSFTPNRDQIIRQAALEVSAIGQGTIMSAEMMNDFAFKLNAMVKHWQGRGLHIWTVRDITLFPVPGQVRYSVGSGATDHITETYYRTTLSAAEASGQTVLSMTSTANIAVSDYVGVVLDDGSVHWTTVAAKDSTTITLAAALTGAAAAENAVYSYTTKAAMPVRVVQARTYDIASASETPIDIVADTEYRALPNKASVSAINQIQYRKQRVNGFFFLWGVPGTLEQLVNMTVWKPFEVFSTGANTPDFPEEWTNCLIWNLANEMSGRYPVSPERRRKIETAAASGLFDMESFGTEDGEVQFVPDRRRR